MSKFAVRMVALASAASMMLSAPVAAASRVPTAAYSPWASLSAFAAPASSQALCGAAAANAAGAAAAAQAGTPGCVFPAVDAPVSAPVANAAPVATTAAVSTGTGVGVLPLLLGLAALGAVAALLLSTDEGGAQISISP